MSGGMDPMDCPHCGARVAPTRGICPACRRDVTDLREAPANRERARLAALVAGWIARGKRRSVIRAVLRAAGEDPVRVDEELVVQEPFYRSAATARGGRELLLGGGLLAAGLLALMVGLLLAGWAAVAFGGMHGALGVQQWWRSLRP